MYRLPNAIHASASDWDTPAPRRKTFSLGMRTSRTPAQDIRAAEEDLCSRFDVAWRAHLAAYPPLSPANATAVSIAAKHFLSSLAHAGMLDISAHARDEAITGLRGCGVPYTVAQEVLGG